MIKRFNEFINESKENTLSYSVFDWDDNILIMETPMHFQKKVKGEWVDWDLTPEQFAKVKLRYPKYWDNEEYRCDFDNAFLEFRDFGPRGKDAFFEDSLKALNDKKYGPSWYEFIDTLVEGRLFAIVTTRGHESDSIRRVVEYIIYNKLSDDQQDKMLKNLMKYHDIFKKDFDYLVDDYLNNCYFIGIMSKYFKKTFGYDPSKQPDKAKSDAVKYVLDRFKKYAKKVSMNFQIGFSDDDPRYSDAIKSLFMSNEKTLDFVEDYYVFDTSNPELRGGKRFKF